MVVHCTVNSFNHTHSKRFQLEVACSFELCTVCSPWINRSWQEYIYTSILHCIVCMHVCVCVCVRTCVCMMPIGFITEHRWPLCNPTAGSHRLSVYTTCMWHHWTCNFMQLQVGLVFLMEWALDKLVDETFGLRTWGKGLGDRLACTACTYDIFDSLQLWPIVPLINACKKVEPVYINEEDYMLISGPYLLPCTRSPSDLPKLVWVAMGGE